MLDTAPFRRRALQICLLTLIALGSAAAAAAQPGFSKIFSPATIGPGSVSTLTFTIDNSGSPGGASSLDFTDDLPAGVTIAGTPLASTSGCGAADLMAPAGGGTITLSGGSVGANGSCTVKVDVTSSVPGVHTNTSGDLTSTAGNSGPATADLTVSAGRPGFLKSFAPASIPVGHVSTLTLTIDNTANGSNADLMSFTDNLPTGMVIATPANAATTCTGGILPATLTASPGGSSVALTFGFVAAGSTCTVTVDVLASVAGALANRTGDLNSSLGDGGMASATLQVRVDFLIKTFTDDPVPAGGTVTLEFRVTNLDRVDTAENIAFTDDLDAALTGLTAVGLPLTDPCGPGSSLTGTSTLSFTGGFLVAGDSCTFSVSLQVPAGAAVGSHTNTTSSVTTDIGGVPTVEPAASDDLVIQPLPLLTKTFTDDPVLAGATATLEFSVTNTDPDNAASGLSFTDDLGAALPGLVATGLPATNVCGPGSSISGTSTLTFTGGNLAAGASCTFDVTVQVPAGAQSGDYLNTTSTLGGTVGDRRSSVRRPATC